MIELKPSVRDARDLIGLYGDRSENVNGGSLHLVIEDGNLEDGHVRECLRVARERGDYLGEVVALALLALTPEDRDLATRPEWEVSS